MARSVQVEGLGKMDAVLRAKAVALKAATAATVALEVASVKADATGGAPKDSGELAGSIEGRTLGTTGEVEATARHAAFVEFGTSHTPAQPYMGPAAESSKARFIGRVAAAARRAVG